jgi:hypothetical protein
MVQPERPERPWRIRHSGRSPAGKGSDPCFRLENGNAPCWIRTSDRLLRRLEVVGLKSLAVTGFVGPKSARCEQKCEQFAGFRPLLCLPSGSWEGVIAVSAMPPFAGLPLSDQQVLADRLI